LPSKKTGAWVVVPLFLALTLVINVTTVASLDPDINKKDRELISYLHEKGVTHAYADYWAANLLTYMDGEKTLKIRPVTVVDGKLQYLYLQSTLRWTDEGWPLDGSPVVDDHPVLITYTPGDPVYDWAQEVNKKYPPVETYSCNYQIPGFNSATVVVYKYNTTLPAWPVESLSAFEARGYKPV
jgi:hypothetical protein